MNNNDNKYSGINSHTKIYKTETSFLQNHKIYRRWQNDGKNRNRKSL